MLVFAESFIQTYHRSPQLQNKLLTTISNAPKWVHFSMCCVFLQFWYCLSRSTAASIWLWQTVHPKKLIAFAKRSTISSLEVLQHFVHALVHERNALNWFKPFFEKMEMLWRKRDADCDFTNSIMTSVATWNVGGTLYGLHGIRTDCHRSWWLTKAAFLAFVL